MKNSPSSFPLCAEQRWLEQGSGIVPHGSNGEIPRVVSRTSQALSEDFRVSLRATILVTLFAAALATAATAQDDNPFIDISVGETYTGQLVAGGDSLVDGSWFEMFLFNGEAGDTVTIAIASIDFNAHLFLADSLDTILETDDDSGGECNPHLAYILPEGGRYIVYVTSTYRAKTGQYELSILPGTVPPPSSKRCGGFFDSKGTLALGEIVEGTLGPPDPKLGGSHYQIWDLEVTVGDSVTVDFKSGNFDAYMVLYRGFATAIASNDDGGGACHARRVIAGSGHPLKVMLRTGKADESGDFTLSMVAGALPLVEESQCLP